MNHLMLDHEKCKGCGKCEERCGYKKVISVNGTGKAIFKEDQSECIECYHCLMVCPNDAISINENPDVKVCCVDEKTPLPLIRHSCRVYKNKRIEKEEIIELINEANSAPRAYIKSKERKYIIVTGERLSNLRTFLLKKIEQNARLFRIILKLPFLPNSIKTNLKNLAWCFTMTTKANKEKEQLFQGAPAVVLVCGPAKNSLSKVNSDYALLQLMILAEQKGFGTCLSGYLDGYSKDISKFLGLPKSEKVFCGAMIGYPAARFTKYVRRNDTSITWI